MRETEHPAWRPRDLTDDYLYPFRGLWTADGLCRIRTFEHTGAVPFVIATELPENASTSITNMAEYLAAEVLERHFPERIGLRWPMVWIEHYPQRAMGREIIREQYDLVTFEGDVPKFVRAGNQWRRSLGTPSWSHLAKETLENMIFQELD
jgi:hypothetical protein